MTTTQHWPAPTTTQRTRSEPRRHRVQRAFVAAIVAGTVAAAIGVGRAVNTLGAVLIAVAVVVATDRAAMLPSRSRRLLAAAGAGFLPWLVVRSSPWLVAPNVVAVVVLVSLALSMRNGAGAVDGVGGYARRVLLLVRGAFETPAHIHLGVQTTLPEGRRVALRQTVVPLSSGLVVAFVVAMVLASGDALFASFLDLDGLLDAAGGRFVAAAVTIALVGTAAGASLTAEARPPIPARRWTSPRNAILVAAPLCAVYVAFVLVQTSSVVLGATYVRNRTGLTFAEYARSGFFQLVGVAALTFAGLLLLRPTMSAGRRSERRALSALASVGAICTLAMVVAAVVKLQLYADVFGLTMLRLYTTVFALWLGVAILIAWCSLGRAWGYRVVAIVSATALVGLVAMNIVDPEEVVAEHNLTNTIDSPEFDPWYLANLSSDAVPELVEHLDELEPADRSIVLDSICRRRPDVSLLDWNLSAARAADAVGEVC